MSARYSNGPPFRKIATVRDRVRKNGWSFSVKASLAFNKYRFVVVWNRFVAWRAPSEWRTLWTADPNLYGTSRDLDGSV